MVLLTEMFTWCKQTVLLFEECELSKYQLHMKLWL